MHRGDGEICVNAENGLRAVSTEESEGVRHWESERHRRRSGSLELGNAKISPFAFCCSAYKIII
jgi:hypothetical protein